MTVERQQNPPTGFERRKILADGEPSVVTVHPIDDASQPMIAARDEILAFFRGRPAE